MKKRVHSFLGDFGKRVRVALKNFFSPLQEITHKLQRRYQKARLDFQAQIHLPGTTKQQIHIVQGLTKKPFRQIHMSRPHRETFLHVNEEDILKEITIHTKPSTISKVEEVAENPKIKHSQLKFI